MTVTWGKLCLLCVWFNVEAVLFPHHPPACVIQCEVNIYTLSPLLLLYGLLKTLGYCRKLHFQERERERDQGLEWMMFIHRLCKWMAYKKWEGSLYLMRDWAWGRDNRHLRDSSFRHTHTIIFFLHLRSPAPVGEFVKAMKWNLLQIIIKISFSLEGEMRP